MMSGSHDRRSTLLRGSLSGTRALEVFLDPVLIVSLLFLSAQIASVSFDKRYFIVAFVGFSINFPGRAFLTDSPRIVLRGTCVDWAIFASTLLLFGYGSGYISDFSKVVIIGWLVMTPAVLIAVRLVIRLLLPKFLALDGHSRTAVVVGCNAVGLRLAQNFKQDPFVAVQCLGFFDDRNRSRLDSLGNLALLGTFAELPQYVQAHRVDHIYLTLPMASQPQVLRILNDLRDTTASIFFVPDIFVTDLIQGRIDNVAGMPVVAVCETPFYGLSALAKRALDIAVASAALVATSPLLLGIAAWIKLTSPGPVIFKQRRYGLDGKEILVYKFRTMSVMEDGDTQYKQVERNDARVTPCGAILRRFSLDELPQLLNVFKGSMSIVGPRPHAVAVNEQYRRQIAGYMVRHKVKPGITGWAQVNGYRGGDDLESMTRRIEYDLDYLRSWSLGLDLLILLKTTLLLLGGDHRAY